MLFLKSTAAPIAPGIYAVDVAAKPPGKTYMIYMALDAAEPPHGFIAAVEGMGFKQALRKPYVHHDGTKVIDMHFQKAGTDIFEGWTAAEKDANLAAIDQLLASYEISAASRIMSLAEAFR